MVNHDASHKLGGRSDKVGTILPIAFRIVDQVQVRLIQKSGGLERVPEGFPAHVVMREPMQFRLH